MTDGKRLADPPEHASNREDRIHLGKLRRMRQAARDATRIATRPTYGRLFGVREEATRTSSRYPLNRGAGAVVTRHGGGRAGVGSAKGRCGEEVAAKGSA